MFCTFYPVKTTTYLNKYLGTLIEAVPFEFSLNPNFIIQTVQCQQSTKDTLFSSKQVPTTYVGNAVSVPQKTPSTHYFIFIKFTFLKYLAFAGSIDTFSGRYGKPMCAQPYIPTASAVCHPLHAQFNNYLPTNISASPQFIKLLDTTQVKVSNIENNDTCMYQPKKLLCNIKKGGFF